MSHMLVHVLFGIRKESYEGEYGPEVLAAVDEFCNDENPEYFEKLCAEQREKYGKDFQVMRVVDIKVDHDKVRKLLLGTPAVEGEIKV